MRNFFQKCKDGLKKAACGGGMVAITMPTLPTTDLETAIGTVLALVAVAVVGGVIIRTLKKA